MNQFYRALHMPPKRLLRKVMGEKEVYTIAVRPRPTAEGTEPAARPGCRPLHGAARPRGLVVRRPALCHRGGQALAVCLRRMVLSTGKGRLECVRTHDDGSIDGWLRGTGGGFSPFLPDGV